MKKPRRFVDPQEARKGHTCHLDHDVTLTFKFPQGKVTPATEKRRARASQPLTSRSPFKVTPAAKPIKLIPRGGRSDCECTHVEESEYCFECNDEENEQNHENYEQNYEQNYEENYEQNYEENYEESHSMSMIDYEAAADDEPIDLNDQDLDDYFQELQENDQIEDENEIESRKSSRLSTISSLSNSSNPSSSLSSRSKRSSLSNSPVKNTSRVHLPLKDSHLKRNSLQSNKRGSLQSSSSTSSSTSSSSPTRGARGASTGGTGNSSKYINYLSNRSPVRNSMVPSHEDSLSSSPSPSQSPPPNSPLRSSRQSNLPVSPMKPSKTVSKRASISSYSPLPSKSTSSSTSSSSSFSPANYTGTASGSRSSRSKSPSSTPLTHSRAKSPSVTSSSAKRGSLTHSTNSHYNRNNSTGASSQSQPLSESDPLTPVKTPSRSKSPSSIPVRSPNFSHSSPLKASNSEGSDVLTPIPTSPSKIPISFSSSLRDSPLINQTNLDFSPYLPPNTSLFEPESDTKERAHSGSSVDLSILSDSNDFPITNELYPLKNNYENEKENHLKNTKNSKNYTKNSKNFTNSPIKTKKNSNSTTFGTSKRLSLTPTKSSTDSQSPTRRSSLIPFQNSNSRLESRKSILEETSLNNSSLSSSSLSLTSSKITKNSLPSSSLSAHFSVNSLAILGFSSSEYTELFSGIAIDLEPLTIKAFDKSNPKMLLVILHFLLVILDSEEFPPSITKCWPYLDNSERAQFRRACYVSLTSLTNSQNQEKNERSDFTSPYLNSSLYTPKILQEANGHDCWSLIRVLTDLALEREFLNPHDPNYEVFPQNHQESPQNSENSPQNAQNSSTLSKNSPSSEQHLKEQIFSNMNIIQNITEEHFNSKKILLEYLNELQTRNLQCQKHSLSVDHTNFIQEIHSCNNLLTKINQKKEILTSICHSPLFPHINQLINDEMRRVSEEKNERMKIMNEKNQKIKKNKEFLDLNNEFSSDDSENDAFDQENDLLDTFSPLISLSKQKSRQKLCVDPNMRQFQFKMSEAIETLTQNLLVLCENLHNTTN